MFSRNRIPKYTLIGLKAALSYYDKNDKDSAYLKKFKKSLTEAEILKKISGVDEKDPISLLCKKLIKRSCKFQMIKKEIEQRLQVGIKAARSAGEILELYANKIKNLKIKNNTPRDITVRST